MKTIAKLYHPVSQSRHLEVPFTLYRMQERFYVFGDDFYTRDFYTRLWYKYRIYHQYLTSSSYSRANWEVYISSSTFLVD